MTIRTTDDRSWLVARLRRDPFLHLYELGDLDDFFWPRTTWFTDGERVALQYDAGGHVIVLVLARDPALVRSFFTDLVRRLPPHFYAHLAPGLVDVLGPRVVSREPHLRMALTAPSLDVPGVDAVDPLGPADRDEVEAFYAAAYPGNWFDPRMLATGQYVGRRVDGALACVAGVHVYSEAQRVASLGNIATHPAHRGRGLAKATTARLCQGLRARVDHIGLNVHAHNAAAIALYQQLGFTAVTGFDEVRVISPQQGVPGLDPQGR